MNGPILHRRLVGHASQQAFDCFLRTLAEPGSVRRIPPEARLDGMPPVATLALALADVEVTVSVDGQATHPLASTIAELTGATIAPLGDALFVTLTEPSAELVRRCPVGSALAPEEGARLAIAAAVVEPGATVAGPSLRLSGPGIPGERTVTVGGVEHSVLHAVIDANRRFPAGVDTWFVDPAGSVTAISRSTRCTLIEED